MNDPKKFMSIRTSKCYTPSGTIYIHVGGLHYIQLLDCKSAGIINACAGKEGNSDTVTNAHEVTVSL